MEGEGKRKGRGGLLQGREWAVGEIKGGGRGGGDRVRVGSWGEIFKSYIFHFPPIFFSSFYFPFWFSSLDSNLGP